MDKKDLETLIMERIHKPGWVTTRAILPYASDAMTEQDHRPVQEVMKSLARRGLVNLWRLILQDGGEELLAAARPGLELDKDLEERGAWATAVRYELDT